MTFYRWLEKDAHLRELLDTEPAELRHRLDDVGGDINRLAADLQTSPAVLTRLLARKR
jgi:hypothetical protein